MSKLIVVVGGQYGSEGKGAIAGYLSKNVDLAIRVGGPNAGHTVTGRCPPGCAERETADGIGAHGPEQHPWRLRQVPVAAVTNENAKLMLAAGSEIDTPVLLSEIQQLDSAGYFASERILVDATATVIREHHKLEEARSPSVMADEQHVGPLVTAIGSTGKGIGAARADRAMRRAMLVRDVNELSRLSVHTDYVLQHQIRSDATILVEGTQGYALGQHAGHYPWCTSSDCRATDFLSMAGLNPWSFDELEIWVVFRANPIRVAGNSGPLRDETTWEDLGLQTELTTVTQKVRRVGKWDPGLAKRALRANGYRTGGPVHVAYTMADHDVPNCHGAHKWGELDAMTAVRLDDLLDHRAIDMELAEEDWIKLIGTGPSSVIDRRGDVE